MRANTRARAIVVSKTALFFCVCLYFFSACALLVGRSRATSCLDIRSSSLDAHPQPAGHYHWHCRACSRWSQREKNKECPPSIFLCWTGTSPTIRDKASLHLGNQGGPGSHPPHCVRKCGTCTPCCAVHVTVPPWMTPGTREYYPEAWRCKCGNWLYIP